MSLGNLVGTLGINRKAWTGGLSGAKSEVKSFSGSVGSLFTPAVAVIAGGAAAIAGAYKSVGSAQTQLGAEAKLAAVLKATGGAAELSAKEIHKFASARQDITNFGDEATIAAAAVLGTFKEIKGDIFKGALVSMQDMAAVMGTDVQGGAVQLGKALNDPIKGVSALSKVGVSFTDGQREMIKSLQESGDMMGAQKIILDELKGEFGGAAVATASPMKQMANAVGDVSEMLGFVLLPSLNVISNAITGSLAPITGNADAYKLLGQSIADVVTVGIVPLVSVAKGAFELLTTGAEMFSWAIGNAADLSKLAMIGIAQALLDLLPVSEDTASSIAANLIAGFAAAKAFAGSFVGGVIGGLKEILNVGKAVASAIAAAFKALVNGENPLTAFSESFIDTLANQKDVQAPNIAAVMSDTFKAAKEQTMNSIKQSGGVGGFLDNQRTDVLGSIANRAAANPATLPELKVAPVTIAAGPDLTTTSKGNDARGINTALDAKSAAGLSAILAATQGGPVDLQKQGNAILERIEKVAKDRRDAELAAQRKAERQKRPIVVRM